MTFHIELEVQSELPVVMRTSDVEVHRDGPLSERDEVADILSVQCRALAAAGGILFHVGGFGQDPWPVDVETDLAVVMEQVPGVLAGLRVDCEPFQLNFYEQGIERYLTGIRRGDDVKLECNSMSLRWSPDPAVEVIRLAEAEKMFTQLRATYVALVQQVCPWLAYLPGFKAWGA